MSHFLMMLDKDDLARALAEEAAPRQKRPKRRGNKPRKLRASKPKRLRLK